MKLMDKQIKTGMELAREEVRAPSVTAKIEERVRAMLIEKFGYILSPHEVKQIFRRETERGDKRHEAITRSQWNIMRSKERAKLMDKIRRNIQEGTLFKKYDSSQGGKPFKKHDSSLAIPLPGRSSLNPQRERKSKEMGEPENAGALQFGNGESGNLQPLIGAPFLGPKPKKSGPNINQTTINY